VRLPSGDIGWCAPKRFQASRVRSPLLRGPARLAEAFAVLPAFVARSPRPVSLTRHGAGGDRRQLAAVRLIRSSPRAGSLASELSTVALTILPAAVSLRGSELTAYHAPSTHDRLLRAQRAARPHPRALRLEPDRSDARRFGPGQRARRGLPAGQAFRPGGRTGGRDRCRKRASGLGARSSRGVSLARDPRPGWSCSSTCDRRASQQLGWRARRLDACLELEAEPD